MAEALDPLAGFPELERAALVDRRMALKLMAASAALAAASGCGRNQEERLAGAGDAEPVDVPTTLDQDGLGFGVVVRTVNGRPVKIEGHPDHPASLGRSTVFAQAALLSHYDPERLTRPVVEGREVGWKTARALLERIRGEVAARRGEGLHILVQPTASPTLERMRAAMRAALPDVRFHRHRAVPLRHGPPPNLDGDFLLAFEEDFLGPGPAQVANAEAYMAARRRGIARGRPPRLVVVESIPTLTGARADQRIALDPRGQAEFAEAIAAALNGGSAIPEAAAIARALRQAERAVTLIGARAGDRVRRALPPTDASPSIRYFDDRGIEPIDTLAEALAAGTVDTLLILGGNPAYDTPPRLRFAERIGRARRALYLGPERNETSERCPYRIPGAGLLTGWGDLRAPDGTASLIRPVGEKQGLAPIELLALLAGRAPDGAALVRETHGLAPDAALPGGILLPGAAPVAAPASAAAPPDLPQQRGLTLILHPGHHVGGGALAGNAWAQELPDPITGLAWSNAATLASATAAMLGIEDGDVVEIVAGGMSARAPALVLEGQALGTVALALGYGRSVGAIAEGVGANGYALADAGWVRTGATVRKTGERARLVFPNAPFRPARDDAVRHVAPGEAVARRSSKASFVAPDRRATKQWGMVIDLDACIGCNACAIACQAENNVPVVGPEECAAGRVMHWLRVDRHEGERGTAYQPVPCMHCESAPCEPVCPVEATTHSSEGLNQMTYQRCIGTRSCSNNCPYKVRRFNWFAYAADDPRMESGGENPRVTVRDRGVMEKCTYCVQRIEAVRTGDRAGPPITACQQACPTQAISFGDLADAEDPVHQTRASERNYALLDGLNLMPRTTYLAKIDPEDGDG